MLFLFQLIYIAVITKLQIYTSFICSLFNDAFSRSHSISSNERAIGEGLIRNDVEGRRPKII
jgi:hypothetical protein